MKKNYLLIIAIFFSFGVNAQKANNLIDNIIQPGILPPIHPGPGLGGLTGGGTHLWLEYDSADAYSWGDPQIHVYAQCIMNKRYPAGMAHSPLLTPFQYAIVKFDSLWDVKTSPLVGVKRDTVNNILVDSIYTAIGHSNHSGTADTLVLRILDLITLSDGSRYPGTTTLWSDTIFTSVGLSTSNNYKTLMLLTRKPNHLLSTNGFAVELDYYGSTDDTCVIAMGFHNNGAQAPNCLYRAAASSFYPNSYLAWTDFASTHPLIPDNPFYDVSLDCDGSGTFDPAHDGYNPFQNIIIGAYITINSVTGIHEDLKNIGIGLYQNVPNPLHNTTDIKYELANNAKDVSLYVYDLVGSKLMEVKEGNRSPGNYTIHLDASKFAKGVYTYTLRVDGSQVTRKMIVE